MKRSKAEIARDYQKQIAELEAMQEKLYRKALRALKVPDTAQAFDFMYNNQNGYSSWLEGLK